MFAAICAGILALILAWCAGLMESESGLWVLSTGVGTAYGCLFTLSVSAGRTDYNVETADHCRSLQSYRRTMGLHPSA